jgi:hypothetical protein
MPEWHPLAESLARFDAQDDVIVAADALGRAVDQAVAAALAHLDATDAARAAIQHAAALLGRASTAASGRESVAFHSWYRGAMHRLAARAAAHFPAEAWVRDLRAPGWRFVPQTADPAGRP